MWEELDGGSESGASSKLGTWLGIWQERRGGLGVLVWNVEGKGTNLKSGCEGRRVHTTPYGETAPIGLPVKL